MAWLGQPLLIGDVIFDATLGLVDPSRRTRAHAGGGFGLGWYGAGRTPALFRTLAPAGADPQLRRLAARIRSPLFVAFAGTSDDPADRQPLRWGRWLVVHDGVVAGFRRLRRDLLAAFGAAPLREAGVTDTEMVLHLARRFGLEADPVEALERAVGAVETAARRRGVTPDVQACIGITDGTLVWGVRYATRGSARPLYLGDHPAGHLMVSGPAVPPPPAWREVGGDTALTLRRGERVQERRFCPRPAPAPAPDLFRALDRS